VFHPFCSTISGLGYRSIYTFTPRWPSRSGLGVERHDQVKSAKPGRFDEARRFEAVPWNAFAQHRHTSKSTRTHSYLLNSIIRLSSAPVSSGRQRPHGPNTACGVARNAPIRPVERDEAPRRRGSVISTRKLNPQDAVRVSVPTSRLSLPPLRAVRAVRFLAKERIARPTPTHHPTHPLP
jgi:hypothetical protein